MNNQASSIQTVGAINTTAVNWVRVLNLWSALCGFFGGVLSYTTDLEFELHWRF